MNNPMSTIRTRLQNAWQALRDKPAKTVTVGIETRRCDMCDYYKAAHEPAQTVADTKKAPTWTDGPLPYYHVIEYLEKIVLVKFYQATDDGPVEISRGYGRIIYPDAAGIAQATSYAMKCAWYKTPKPHEEGIE